MVLNGKNMLKLNEDFIKSYDEDINKGYIREVNIKYSKKLHNLHCDLPLSPEKMKIDKYNKVICNLYDKKSYVVHIRALKQALNHGIMLKKVHKAIQFNQEAWLKEYIEMYNELREQAKMILKKFSLN